MKPNLPQHPCANKCTEFKDEQCKTCLVQENVTQTCIDCGSTDLYKGGEIKEPKMCLDCFASMTGFSRTGKGFVETGEIEHLPTHKSFDADFIPGDVVVYLEPQMTAELRTVVGVFPDRIIVSDSKGRFANGAGIRPATTAEIQANRRLTEAEQAIAEVS